MKDKSNILDSYFKTAKNEKLGISLKDIGLLVTKAAAVGVVAGSSVAQASIIKQGLFNLKYLLISGTAITTTVVTVAVYTANTKANDNNNNESAIAAIIDEPTVIEDTIPKTLLEEQNNGPMDCYVMGCDKETQVYSQLAEPSSERMLAYTATGNADTLLISEIKATEIVDMIKHPSISSELAENIEKRRKTPRNKFQKLQLDIEPYFRFFYLYENNITIANSTNKTVYNEVSGLIYNNRKWAKTRIKRKYGFVDSQGNEIVETKYDKIFPFSKRDNYWAKVLLNQKYGFINVKGQLIVEPRYNKIYPFSESREAWAKVKVNKRFGFINNKGDEIVSCIYDKIFSFDVYQKGWAKVKLNGRYGFIDNKGKLVVPVVYSEIGYFDEITEGYMRVKKGDVVLFIDKHGTKL